MGILKSLLTCRFRPGVRVLAVAGLWFVSTLAIPPRGAWAQEGDVMSLFEKGLSSYQAGDRAEASSAFEKAFVQRPSVDVVNVFVDKATVAQIIDMVRDEDPKISGIGLELLKIARRTTIEFSDDSEAIAAAVKGVLESDGQERIRGMIEYASRLGRNLVPALIPYLAGADLEYRTTAFIWISHHIGRDAVAVLVAAWNAPQERVRINVAKLLGARDLRDTYSLAYLKAMVEQDDSDLVKEEARASLAAIAAESDTPALATEPAKKLFLRNAYSLFLHPYRNLFDKSAYTAKIYHLEGEQVVGERVARFQVSERMAAQNLEEALRLDPSYRAAQVLALLDDCAQVVEYDHNLEWHSSRDDRDAETLAILEAQSAPVNSVLRLRTLVAPTPVLYAGLRQALKYRRSEVARYIIERIRERGLRGAVPSALIDALEDSNSRLVRVAAARTLAEWNPQSGFDAGAQVVKILASAVVRGGVRTVVKAMGNQELANRFDAVLEHLNMESNFHLETVAEAFGTVRRLPPDLILVDEELRLEAGREAAKPINRFIVELRGDYRTADVPVVVVVDPARRQKATEDYADAESKVWVVPANVDAASLRKRVLDVVFGQKGDAKDLATRLATGAAEALETLATRPSPAFPIAQSVGDITPILSNRPDPVRIPCMRALAGLGAAASSAVEELVQVFADEDSSVDAREAAMVAAGRILAASGKGASDPVLKAISAGTRQSDLRLRRAAWLAFADAGFEAEDLLALLTTTPPVGGTQTDGAAGPADASAGGDLDLGLGGDTAARGPAEAATADAGKKEASAAADDKGDADLDLDLGGGDEKDAGLDGLEIDLGDN